MKRLLPLAVLAFVTCIPSIDPDKGKYTCAKDADCGDGYECRKQLVGGSLCFKKGTCAAAETCNGKDDDCNGAVDDAFPDQGKACTTTGKGVCAAGTLNCVNGAASCVQSVDAGVETCNGKDDDCNGMIDETFNLTSDNANCGSCGRACVTGTGCQNSICRETNCADGIDNDADGGIDCADPACQQRTCLTTPDASYSCGVFFDAGVIDAGFPDAGDLDGGDLDAGVPDAGEVDAGTDAGTKFFCFPPEVCDDGVDDDGDQLTDCADPDCNGKTCMSGTVCTNLMCPGPG